MPILIGAVWGGYDAIRHGGNLADVVKGVMIGAIAGGIGGAAGSFVGGQVGSLLGKGIISTALSGTLSGATQAGIGTYFAGGLAQGEWNWNNQEWNSAIFGGVMGGLTSVTNYGVNKALSKYIGNSTLGGNPFANRITPVFTAAGTIGGAVEGTVYGWLGSELFGWDRKSAISKGFLWGAVLGGIKGYVASVRYSTVSLIRDVTLEQVKHSTSAVEAEFYLSMGYNIAKIVNGIGAILPYLPPYFTSFERTTIIPPWYVPSPLDDWRNISRR